MQKSTIKTEALTSITYKTHSQSRRLGQYNSTYSNTTYKGYGAYEQGMSVSGVVFILLALGVFVKLAIAIIPAQVGDYQFTKLVAQELKKSNEKKQSANEFLNSLDKQLSINASYDTDVAEMITITNKTKGSLAVNKDYEVANNFFGDIDIVNNFKGEITAADANE